MEAEATNLSIRNLQLNNFRNHKNLTLELTDQPVVITGDNGAGKTNILESISFLTPGRGLRNAKLSDIDNNIENLPWELYSKVKTSYNISEIIIKKDKEAINSDKRSVIINGEKAKTRTELNRIFSVIWLTPQMDNLFLLGGSERRKFFDRLVYNIFPSHASNVSRFEYFMRERNSLLKESNFDQSWLDVLETKMSEFAVAIATSRVEAIVYLQKAIDENISNFPKAGLKLLGELENLVATSSKIEIEEKYKNILKINRHIDRSSGRTTIGPHRTDLIVTHLAKNQLACYCSTGEQKALLINIILADAKAKIKAKSFIPLILLDEVAAHLDNKRKNELFEELLATNSQFWVTGIENSIFSELKNKAQFLTLENSQQIR